VLDEECAIQVCRAEAVLKAEDAQVTDMVAVWIAAKSTQNAHLLRVKNQDGGLYYLVVAKAENLDGQGESNPSGDMLLLRAAQVQ
jgi:hypothetical protein